MKKNPLVDLLPPKVRKYAYATYALAVVATAVWGILGHVPDQVMAVETAIGAALGATAASNVKPEGVKPV